MSDRSAADYGEDYCEHLEPTRFQYLFIEYCVVLPLMALCWVRDLFKTKKGRRKI